MPSVTTIDGYTFDNWGPVTTTFTPPATCATSTTNIRIGPTQNGSAPYFLYAQQCSTIGYWDCMPTGIESKAVITASTFHSNPTDAFRPMYFSPGLYCPSGWATVGLAARGESTLSGSGILSTASPIYNPDIPEFENPATLIMSLLDPSETVAMCCPRFVQKKSPWISE
ncbi:uncharacterized protein N7484_010325 [Penicillium longicatenatum]|uniref:uncharacterized protein n=1 Tax=Penicillium longicatenatum TaxID=1561947 RepID=UPI00254662C1|nr:uncharacterized protein N7484_010325 [Penicillium longicatenatum]KAJ5630225.1 hypothetical protein N7484_010325 [Penicillium longicatenatum]